MKSLTCLFSLACGLAARAETAIEATATNIPAGTSEVLFVLDTTTPVEGPGYEDPNAPPAPATPPVAIPPAAGQPAAVAAAPDPNAPNANAAAPAPAPPRRRRNPGAAKPPTLIRGSVAPARDGTATWRTAAPAGENYRVRAVAVKGTDQFPLVLAGGKSAGLKLAADQVLATRLALERPTLSLAPENPGALAPGARFTLSGTIGDPGNFLGAKNRMRAWLSGSAAPLENRAGVQTSSVEVTTTGTTITFAIELTAPKASGPLFVQFGEVSPDFNRPDGTQVPFLVLPDVASGEPPLKLQVGAVASQR